jgi:ribosomal protein S18 acetylase RimI-like enzyme
MLNEVEEAPVVEVEQLPIRFLHHVATVDGLTNCEFLVLEGEEVVASCRVEQWSLPGGWITWVHVPEHRRRRGFATLLIDHVLHAAQVAGKEGLTLTVQAANEPAQLLYRSLGFRTVGVPYYDLTNLVMTHHFAPMALKGGPQE